jgi:hypothetical protein
MGVLVPVIRQIAENLRFCRSITWMNSELVPILCRFKIY